MTIKKMLLLTFTVSILGLSIKANAQAAPSAGCDILNGVDLATLNPTGAILGAPRAFFAGDTIVATVASPTATGTPTGVQLEIDTIVVDSDSFPGSVTYVFPADGNFQVDMRLDAAQATWTLTCGQPIVPPVPGPATAAPVPTLSVWALGVLIALTGLIGFSRRRNM